MAKSLAQSTYAQMRKDIIFGRLEPGRRLTLDELKTPFKASVPTLREVLNRLAAEGFVVATGQKGFSVAPISVENLREIAEMRELIETNALGRSIASGDVEWETRVVAAHYRLAQSEQLVERLSDENNRDEWKRCDLEFHRALISACGSAELMATHALVIDKYLRYQMLYLTYRGEIAQIEHKEMRDAAIERRAEYAQEILVQHIRSGVAHALEAHSRKARVS